MEQRGEAQVPLVLLATSREWAEGEPGHGALDAALTAHGLASRWVVWDDLGVDWGTAEVVAVRSTWDYDGRRGEFLGWASGVKPTPRSASLKAGRAATLRTAAPTRPPAMWCCTSSKWRRR